MTFPMMTTLSLTTTETWYDHIIKMISMMILQFQLQIICSFKPEWEKYNFIMLYLPICNRIVNLFIFTYKNNTGDYSRKWVDKTVMIFPLLNKNSSFNKNTDRYLCCYLCCHLCCYLCTPLQRRWQKNTFPSRPSYRNCNQTNCFHFLCNKRWTCF